MKRSDSRELLLALATVIRTHADAAALVMCCWPEIDPDNADAIVNTIRFGVRANGSDTTRRMAMERRLSLDVDWKTLLAVVKDEGAAKALGGAQ
jgi:hypothetical protein